MRNEHQDEFFKEFKEEKGKFKKITDKMMRRRPRFYVHISLENIVILAITGIMCVIIAFAFGVERGKRISVIMAKAPQVKKITVVSEKKKTVPPLVKKNPQSEQLVFKDPFTIQLISYKQKEVAEKERDRLRNKKIRAFIVSAGKWHQVCAGTYKDMETAKKALKELSKEYKDCFIRNVSG